MKYGLFEIEVTIEEEMLLGFEEHEKDECRQFAASLVEKYITVFNVLPSINQHVDITEEGGGDYAYVRDIYISYDSTITIALDDSNRKLANYK